MPAGGGLGMREGTAMGRLLTRLGGWALVVACALGPAGCSRRGEGHLVPSEATARQALEAALSAWKGGQAKPGPLSLGKVGVEVMDDAWRAGEKLTAYEITAEEGGQGPRWFTANLTLPKGARSVKYVVFGNDPIWVYTEAEYKKLSGS
jgi:hypothetical protein